MRQIIIHNMRNRIEAYADLITEIDASNLTAKLAVPKDKSIAEHLWCIVGSRESYAKALLAGQWQGFSCSMTQYTLNDFVSALNASADLVLAAIRNINEWSPERDQLLAALAEHEMMHEGQIIRHMYGLGRTLPASWKWA